MIANIEVELSDTDRVISIVSRPIINGEDSPRVILGIGSLTITLPRALAGEVVRKIATALEEFR